MDSNARGAPDLFFGGLVRSYVEENPRFLRRDWLAAQLDENLREAGCRFVLLTAEPGAGKSVFMAQLAHDHPEWLRYFIRRDQRTPLGDVGVHSFLLRIGYQLAARFPELFTPENLTIAVEQRLGTVEDKGEAVGAEIGKIVASPFYRSVIQIQQHVESIKGNVIGLRVDELWLEPRSLDPGSLQFMALIDPATARLKSHPNEQIVILIDALDEIRYHQRTENILAWLTNCSALPENIRFVLTSRPPDAALELFCAKQASYVSELTIAKDDPRVKGDIKAFVSALVSEKRFAEILQQTADGAPAFAEKTAAKADGNLGYLDALARGIDHALASDNSLTLMALLSLEALPVNLEGLYAFFLNQIKVAVKDQVVPVGRNSETKKRVYRSVWMEVYRPILGVLAVAFEPSTLIQLKALGGIAVGLEDVGEAVARMKQFLDCLEGRYRLYHSTVGEFLTAQKTAEQVESADLYLDAEEWHRNVAYELQERAETTELWKDSNEELDQARRRYGREHYLEHLYSGKDHEGLSRTLDGMTYGLGKLEFDPSGLLFIQDLDLARNAVCKHDTSLQANPAKLPVLWRYSLLRCALSGAVAAYPESTLITLAALSREQEAIRLARLMPTLEAQASALVCIAGMLGQEASKRHETRVLFNDAFGILRQLSGEKQAQVATTILNCLHSLVTQVSWWDDEIIRDWLEEVRIIPDTALASNCLVHICVLLLKKKDESASRILQDALTTAGSLQESERSSTFFYVCMTLIACGACDHAQTVLAMVAARDRLRCLCALARRLKKEGEDKQAQLFLAQALVLWESISEQEEQFVVSLDLARTYAELGNIRRAEELLKKTETDISSVQPEPARLNVLCSLAVGFDGAGFKRECRSVIARAITIARSLERSRVPQPGYYISYFGPIIATLRQLGMWKHVFRLAKQVKTSDRVYALSDAARAACAAKQWDNALQIVEMIRAVADGSPFRVRMRLSGSEETADPFYPPSQALIEICVGLAQSGEWQRAISVSDQIAELDAHSAALGAIAQELIAQDRKQEAREVLRRQRGLMRREYSGVAMNEIAVSCAAMLVRSGEWALVKQLLPSIRFTESARPLLKSLFECTNWRSAVGIAREIQDVSTRANLLIEIAANIKTDRQAAIELLEESERIPEVVDGNYRVRAALVFASLGEPGRAVERLKLAEREFREGGPYFLSPRPLARMPEHYAAVGDLVAASDLAHALDDEYERAYAFQRVASVAHKRGDEAVAVELLNKAATTVRQMRRYPRRVPYLVGTIADVFTAMGKMDTAAELLREFKQDPRGHKVSVSLEFGNQLTTGGAFAEAIVTVDNIEDINLRIVARSHLASAMARAGETQAALDQMKTAWREAATYPDTRFVSDELVKVASTLVSIGMSGTVLQLIEREWLDSHSSQQLIAALAAAGACSDSCPKLGFDLHDASKWTAKFLERWGNEVEA
jgi:hypothetical protein